MIYLKKIGQDVHAYSDEGLTDLMGIYPSGQTQPTKRHRYYMLNCVRWRVIWK